MKNETCLYSVHNLLLPFNCLCMKISYCMKTLTCHRTAIFMKGMEIKVISSFARSVSRSFVCSFSYLSIEDGNTGGTSICCSLFLWVNSTFSISFQFKLIQSVHTRSISMNLMRILNLEPNFRNEMKNKNVMTTVK